MPSQCSDDHRGVFARHLYERSKTRMAFHQSGDMTVFRATQQIPFPMTRYSAVLYFRRPFPDRDGIRDLTARVFKDVRVARAAYAALGAQMPQQLFFQHSAGLDE